MPRRRYDLPPQSWLREPPIQATLHEATLKLSLIRPQMQVKVVLPPRRWGRNTDRLPAVGGVITTQPTWSGPARQGPATPSQRPWGRLSLLSEPPSLARCGERKVAEPE